MKSNNVDSHTLELLPVAVILFDNKRIYYLNKKAISLFKITATQLKQLDQLSVFSFINKAAHKKLTSNNNLILKGKLFPAIELECYNLKKEKIFL